MNAPSMLGPVLAFAGVLALIPLALWLLKRTPLGAAAGGGSGGGAMRVVGALPLAPNQRLVTVEVGQGEDRRWLVLGVTPGGIHTLHTLPPQPEPVARITPLGPFAQLLARQQRAAGANAPGTPNPHADDSAARGHGGQSGSSDVR